MKINLHDLTHTIARAAPLLGSAFAGPGGAAIGTLIAAKFGGDAKAPDALHALIQADPNASIKLKEIEAEHAVALQRLQLETASFMIQEKTQDAANARQREVLVSNTPLAARDRTPALLAYSVTAGLFTALGGLYCCTIPEGNQAIVLAISSSLTTVWIGAMGYYHGSSIGSRVKDASLLHHLHQGPVKANDV
jgi:hypothetical protein